MGLKQAYAEEFEEYGWTVEEDNTGIGTVATKLKNENGTEMEIKYSDWERLVGGGATVTIIVDGDEETFENNARQKLAEALESTE